MTLVSKRNVYKMTKCLFLANAAFEDLLHRLSVDEVEALLV